MKYTKRNLMLLVTVFAIAMSANGLSTANASSSSPAVYGTIDSASYGNYDNAGNTLDILYNMTVYISDFSTTNAQNGYYLTLLLGIQYPDGSQIWYKVNFVSYVQTFQLRVYFYNTVTQSGWYTAMSYSYPTYGHNKPFYSSLEFDPPSAGISGTPQT